MFKKLFKNKEEIKEAIFNKEAIMEELPIIARRLYPTEVLKIHNEFNIAADNLLIEANSIIKEASDKNTNKVSRLEALGFKQASQVTELKPLIKQAELSKEQLDYLRYYQQNYPLNKFITEEQVKTICHKWNLVCGDVNRFKGFVPDSNLKEIEAFKLKSVDDISPKIGKKYIILDDWTLYDTDNLTIIEKEKHKFILNDYLNTHSHTYLGNMSSGGILRIEGWGKTFKYTEGIINIDLDIRKAIERNQKTMKICAPVKNMDISGLELKEGYKLKKEYNDIPDPVVLQEVKGGYLILTKWGDESSDPILVNNINN